MEQFSSRAETSHTSKRCSQLQAYITALLLTIPGLMGSSDNLANRSNTSDSHRETVTRPAGTPTSRDIDAFATYQETFQQFAQEAHTGDKRFIDQGRPVVKLDLFDQPIHCTPKPHFELPTDKIDADYCASLPKIAQIDLQDGPTYHVLIDKTLTGGSLLFFKEEATCWRLLTQQSYTGQLDDDHTHSCRQHIYDTLRRLAADHHDNVQIKEGAFPYIENYGRFLASKAVAYIDTDQGCTQVSGIIDIDPDQPPLAQQAGQQLREEVVQKLCAAGKEVSLDDIYITNDYLTPQQVYAHNFNQQLTLKDGTTTTVGAYVTDHLDQRDIPASTRKMLKGLIMLESGYDPRADSGRAQGLLQRRDGWRHYHGTMHRRYGHMIDSLFPEKADQHCFNPEYQITVGQRDIEDVFSLLTNGTYHHNSKVNPDYTYQVSRSSLAYKIVTAHNDQPVSPRSHEPFPYLACHYLIEDIIDQYPDLDKEVLANQTFALSHVRGITGAMRFLQDIIDQSEQQQFRHELHQVLSHPDAQPIDTDEFFNLMTHKYRAEGKDSYFRKNSTTYYNKAVAFSGLIETRNDQ